MEVSRVSPLRLVASNASTGSARMSGHTSGYSTGSVDLTVERTSENEATLKGSVGAFDSGKCDLRMVRSGKELTIAGRVGFGQWSPVNLTVRQVADKRFVVSGNLAGSLGSVDLVIDRVGNATAVTGMIGAYQQSNTGSVDLRVIDSDGVRQYVGKTSKKPEGEVKLAERLEGETLTASGYTSRSFDGKTELVRPAAMRRLEMFDTMVLLILVQAMRRQLAKI